MKSIIKKFLMTVLFVAGILCAAFSQITLKGRLTDSEDGNPLPYANIALITFADSSFVKGTTTDEKGGFQLQVSEAGSYLLRISYLGYGLQHLNIDINEEEKILEMGVIPVVKKGEMLEEVIVVGEKPIYSYESEKKVYNVSEDPSIQGGVANDALQNAPGVYVDMEGNITLRGVSGVEIWLNDKPTRMNAESLKSFLQQLPANSIQKIEVITNPSARYGAEGTGGIINIVTLDKIKRNNLLSFGINASTQISYSPWISYVISNEKFSFNTYLGHFRMENINNSYMSGYVLNEGDTVYGMTNTSEGEWGYNWTYGHVSFTWEIDTNTTFDIWLGGALSSSENSNFSQSIRTMNTGEVFDFTRSSVGGSDGKNANGGLSLERRFKKEGHKISIDGYGGYHSYDQKNDFEKLYSSQTIKDIKYQQNSLSDGIWLHSYIDYKNPFKNNRLLEAGALIGYNSFFYDAAVDTFSFFTNTYEYADQFSNQLNRNSMNGAIYSTYSDSLWIFYYKAGLRYEFAYLNMTSVALADELTRNYGTFFPTLHVSYQSKKQDNFSASYSRRVRYPQWELDPFINRVDDESVSFGNPWLDPAYTDSYEAGYARFFKSGGSFSATLYHRRTMNDITNQSEGVFDQILGRYTVYNTYVNAGKNIYNGADFTITIRPVSDLRLIWYTNLYNQTVYADLGSYVVDKNDFTYDSRLTFMYNYKNLRFHLNGNYRAASETLTGSVDPSYWINATFSADFMNRKLSVRLGVMDIFNWMERSYTTTTPTYISTGSSKQKSQFLTFGLTFRFGKIELERMQKQPDMSMSQG